MKKHLLLITLFVIFCALDASAILFDRRPTRPPETSIYTYPIIGQIPGVQKFYGLGVTVSQINGSEMDFTYVKLRGPSKYFDDDFKIDIITALDLPLFTKHITLGVAYTDIRNGAWPEGERGIDSDPDTRYILLADHVSAKIGELGLHFLNDQFEIYYGMTAAELEPYGLVTPDGDFWEATRAELNESPKGSLYGLYLDDTDSRRDPRIGYRIQYERWNWPSTRKAMPSFYQEDYNYTLFIPFLEKRKIVLVLNNFRSSATVVKKGEIDKELYTCPADAPPECQEALDVIYERRVVDATNGKATSLGGTARLRGYRANRFYDTHTYFEGAELRFYLAEFEEGFNWIVEKGFFTGIQLALFTERGTVAPTKSKLKGGKFKTSNGLGLRFLFGNVIFRTDYAVSQDEGSQTTVYVGYPF
jgi:hypothetical protein